MKRLLPFIVLLVVLLGGLIAVPVLLNPEKHRAEITDQMAKLFKRPIVIGQLSMGYFPPTLQLGQFAIVKEGGNPVLQIESVSAPLDWPALFRLKFIPAELHLNHWKLMVLRKANGDWDLGDWFSGFAGAPGGPRWALGLISWKEGEIHWVDRYAAPTPQELVLGSIEGHWSPKGEALTTGGSFSGLSSTARLTFDADGQFFSSPQWSGELKLSDQSNTCTFHVDNKAGVFEVKGGAAKWPLANALTFLKFYGRGAHTTMSAHPLVLENWQLHLSGNAAHFSFDHAAGISGGVTEAKGRVESTPAGLTAHLDWAVQNIPVQAIIDLAGEELALEGTLTALGKDMQLSLSTRTLSSLQGQGVWELKDGRYPLPAASVQRLAKAKTMGYVKKKFPDVEKNGLPVTRLFAHWSAKDGIISVDDGILLTTDMKAAWAGQLDVARRGVDGYLRLQINEKDPKLTSLIPTTYRRQPAYGHVQGSWQEWSLRSIRPSKIPSGIQAKLRKTISQK